LRTVACCLAGVLLLGACEAGEAAAADSPAKPAASDAVATMHGKESRMWMTIGTRRIAITLADNAAAQAFAAQLPLTLDMEDLNGNEKHAKLPKALPANASRPGTLRTGDLMLWGTDTLVVFYATFRSPYSYTRLGKVEDSGELADALGPRSVRVVFSRE
jgi:hypothetical protein